MTEQEYLREVRQIQAWIASGDDVLRKKAEAAIEPFRHIYPQRLPYLCAEIALMMAHGESAERCRDAVDDLAQEFYPQEGLSDLFMLKSRTYREGSPEWQQLQFIAAFYSSGKLPQQPMVELAEMKAAFLRGALSDKELHDLAVQYYVTRNTLLSAVLMLAWCRRTACLEQHEEHILQDAGQPFTRPHYCGNFGYLARMLTDGSSYTFLLVDDASDAHGDMEVLAEALRILGQHTIVLRVCSDGQPAQDEQSYALKCIQAARADGSRIAISVGLCQLPSGASVDALPAVLRLLARSITQNAPLIVFARDGRMDQLHGDEVLGGAIQRLSHCLPPGFADGLSFAWMGDYLKYISYLYGESAEDLLTAAPRCDISIVIPARNSVHTLRHTLRTCLAVEFTGSYEIVVSDNSDVGYDEIRELCEELNDVRIRYYRTPVVLALDKSFEYALLHARGTFIFSLGSDDGVYPWALTYLQQALAAHPQMMLFSWERGLYTWPGLLPHGRSIIKFPLYDAGEETPYQYFELSADRQRIVDNIDEVFYRLPLCYINSGFRRAYLLRLYRSTGRILDGVGQDSYMGTASLFLNKQVVHLNCPLTTAGMAGSSVGAGTVLYDVDITASAFSDVRRTKVTDQVSEYVMRRGEYRVPYVNTADKLGFFITMARLRDLDVTEDALPIDEMFDYFGAKLSVTDLHFERYAGLLLYAASLCGEEKHRQVQAFYAAICKEPRVLDVQKAELFSDYQYGYARKNQEMTLDARRFDCENVADAVRITAGILDL